MAAQDDREDNAIAKHRAANSGKGNYEACESGAGVSQD